jgi:hypothetical protein
MTGTAPQKEKEKSSGTPGDQMSLVAKFIDKYYLKQKPWVQSLTFVIFVLLFAYGFISSVNGTRVVKGNLWVQIPQASCPQSPRPCSSYASYYEIRWGTQEFVSNSRGEYNITLGFLEYARMLAAGTHGITFLKDGQVIFNGPLKFNRLDGEFEDLTLPPIPGNVTPTNASETDGLLPVVWAGMPAGSYRLVVEGIRPSGGAPKTYAGLVLTAGGNTVEMKDRAHQDILVGQFPIVSDQSIELGSSFYFPVPGFTSLPINGAVKLTTPGGLFQFYSNREEMFPLPGQQPIGQSLQLKGSNGSVLTVRIVYDSEIKVFRGSDIASNNVRLESDLLNQGLLVRWTPSPLGKAQTRETNALWTGKEVRFEIVQRLLRVALAENMGLKKVQYQYAFASTDNPKEIQFGSSPTCAGALYLPIPDATLQKAIDAKTETDFKQIIDAVGACVLSPPKSKVQKTSAQKTTKK